MPETVAHFQVLEQIGSGLLGELHRARDLQKGRTVALRLIPAHITADDASMQALAQDVRRASAVSHPAITAVYELGVDGAWTYIASEFVRGQRLSALVNGSPLNPGRAIDLAVQLADGLADAESQRVVHGALSSDAVIVTPKGAAKLLDVGMTRWSRSGQQPAEDDRVGLAAVLFEMLTGRPLRRGWPAEFNDAAIPAAVRPVLRRMASTAAREQYASMALAAAALRDAAASLTGTNESIPAPAMPIERARPDRALTLIVLTAAAAGLLAVLYVAFHQ